MASSTDAATLYEVILDRLAQAPLPILVLGAAVLGALPVVLVYTLLLIAAPHPRPPSPSEKKYLTVRADGSATEPQDLPCWYDAWRKETSMRRGGRGRRGAGVPLEPAEVVMSVVVPAYNEEERLSVMLEEAVEYLEQEYGSDPSTGSRQRRQETGDGAKKRHGVGNGAVAERAPSASGWEIIVVSDGSTDATIPTALAFARAHSGRIPPSSIRVVKLEKNRGKGGAVVHGMRHVRGQYIVFADADGASKFEDLGKLVTKAQELKETDPGGRAVAIGSRAHLVGSEAVVKRSLLRNTLMHAFHLLLRVLTPPATSSIRDTQCGFKLFTRSSLPYIIPYMHSEGWIFDVEMLMLTEAAGIPMEEVPVGWKEVKGSKLNVVWASLGMAWGLAVVRGAWEMGVWKRA